MAKRGDPVSRFTPARTAALSGALLIIGVVVGGCASSSRQIDNLASVLRGGGTHVLPSGVHVVGDGSEDCPVCAVYERSHESVVKIRVAGGMGAGVVVSADGDIVTNAHVVGDRDDVLVETYHGTIVRGRVERRWKEADLAVISVDAPDVQWSPMEFGPELAPRVGSTIFAIGHPVGLGWTVSQGIVSGHRPIGEVGPVGMIQTDAAVSPGNSGGPLLDGQSNWVGVVSSKLVGPGLENVSFAVPIAEVRKFYLGE